MAADHSACQSTAAVRGDEQLRPSPSPLRWSRCAARLPHIEADVEQRLTAIRRVARVSRRLRRRPVNDRCLRSHIGEGAKSQGARNRTSGYVPQKTPWQGAWDWEENGHSFCDNSYSFLTRFCANLSGENLQKCAF